MKGVAVKELVVGFLLRMARRILGMDLAWPCRFLKKVAAVVCVDCDLGLRFVLRTRGVVEVE